MKMDWLYHATCESVVDGDSIILTIDAGFDVLLKSQSVRLNGIDTAETRGGTPELKALGLLAKDYVTQMVPEGSELLIRTHMDRKGKFGRILGELWRTTNYADKSINEYMVEKHHAAPYHGQSKQDIAEQHLENRKHVDLASL